MSPFDAFNSQSLAEAADVLGRESFTIGGLTGGFDGVLNEFGAEMELIIGGKSGTYTATLICELEQFDAIDAPIERTLYGREITLAGRTFKITRAVLDGGSFTLGLTNPNKGR